jgi:hypothetical protein
MPQMGDFKWHNPFLEFSLIPWTTLVLSCTEEWIHSMNEIALLKLWNQKRTQIIQAQVAPALVLIAVMVLSALGLFEKANDAAKYLALGVAAVTGILAMITQYATIREAEALIVDLKRTKDLSQLSKKIADSRGLVSMTAIAIVGMGIGIFSLVTWAVLGN